MKSSNTRCLVLNADFTVLSIISWQRALTWSIKYDNNSSLGIDIIDFYKDDYIQGTGNKKYPIPAVVKTKKYFLIKNHEIKFSRKNIFIRDNYTCQYCNTEYDISKLTYDHVIPKSRWKKSTFPTTWTNIATACIDCNRKKSNKTLQECGMRLSNLPTIPKKNIKYLRVYEYLKNNKNNIPKEWEIYI